MTDNTNTEICQKTGVVQIEVKSWENLKHLTLGNSKKFGRIAIEEILGFTMRDFECSHFKIEFQNMAISAIL